MTSIVLVVVVGAVSLTVGVLIGLGILMSVFDETVKRLGKALGLSKGQR